jgi:nitric oxide reductase NorQ protein
MKDENEIRDFYINKYDNSDFPGLVKPYIDPGFFISGGLEKVFNHVLNRGMNEQHPENVLLIGPQGCGKTETAMQFAARAGLPLLKLNCALIRESRDWFGHKNIVNGSIEWVESEFSKVLQRGGCVILLDEITRASPPVLNSILPLLDATAMTFLEEIKTNIIRGPDIYFFATANIGTQFSGTYKFDKALDDRFAIRVKVKYVEPKQEAELLSAKTGISIYDANKLVKIAHNIRNDSTGIFGGNLSVTISTRNLIDAARLFATMGTLSFEYTILPLFSDKNGAASQEAHVRKLIQSQFPNIGTSSE